MENDKCIHSNVYKDGRGSSHSDQPTPTTLNETAEADISPPKTLLTLGQHMLFNALFFREHPQPFLIGRSGNAAFS